MESIDILNIQMYVSTTRKEIIAADYLMDKSNIRDIQTLKISENKALRTLEIETKEKEEKLREIWNTTE